MTENLLVSIVIPCFNVSMFIEETLNAVFAQTYKYIEVICVDDGSTDNTLEVLNRYKSDSFKIISISNRGASSARNKGLALSSGKYIQFLDADDIILPEKIATQVDIINKNRYSKPDLILGNYIYEFTNGERTERQVLSSNYWHGLILGKVGITSSNLYSKSILKRVNGWNEKLKSSQDTDLTFRILKTNSSIVNDCYFNTIVKQRSSSISNSSSNRISNIIRSIELREKISSHLSSQKKLTEESRNIILRQMFANIKELATFDLSLANFFFHKNIPPSYIPNDKNINPIYIFLYSKIGFVQTEIILNIYRKLIKW